MIRRAPPRSPRPAGRSNSRLDPDLLVAPSADPLATSAWETPATLLWALRDFDDGAFVLLCKDLEVDTKTLPESDDKDKKMALVRMFDDRDQLDMLDDAIKRAQSIRSLKNSIPVANKPTIILFMSYSHKDEKYCNELRGDLKALEERIEAWYDGKILPGDEIDETVKNHLDEAHIILLLVSRDFLRSDYVRQVELPRALERHEAGEARVIPIILRPSPWDKPPWDGMFGRLKALPKDGKALIKWKYRDEAWGDIYRGIQEAIAQIIREGDETMPAQSK